MLRPRCSTIIVFSSSFPFSLTFALKVIAGSSTIPRSAPHPLRHRQAPPTSSPSRSRTSRGCLSRSTIASIRLGPPKVTWVYVDDGPSTPSTPINWIRPTSKFLTQTDNAILDQRSHANRFFLFSYF
jgi:hypothetical protein